MSNSVLPASSISERSGKDADGDNSGPILGALGGNGGSEPSEKRTAGENEVEPHVIARTPSPSFIPGSDENKNDPAVEQGQADADLLTSVDTVSSLQGASSSNQSSEQAASTSTFCDPTPTPGSGSTDLSPSRSPSLSTRRTITMPALVDLTELTLHSPSSQIVGTPFATNTTRFEYPFPENPTFDSTSSSPPLISSMALSPSLITGASASTNSISTFTAPISGSSFPAISTSSSTTQISPPFISYPSVPAEIALSYRSAHPKLRAPSDPPVPPSLAKKRTRWTLNLLGRRKSSLGGSQSSEPSVASPTMEAAIIGAQQSGSPLGSPQEEKSRP